MTYEIRTKPNVIMMDACKSLYNNGQPYIGIMQIGSKSGFYCKYLRNDDTNLRDFLVEEKEKIYEW